MVFTALDQFGHVNNARYLEFLEEGRWTYSEENRLLEIFKRDGITHAAVNINIDYKKSATDGDRLTVETTVGQISNKSITFVQYILMESTGEVVAKAFVTNVYLDKKNNVLKTSQLGKFWDDVNLSLDAGKG